ncbi:Isopentenyl-diphosphate Delta-isomerase [Slackia heliotrinireducens]|uniref:Isopentenyl-diphosphate Delta-isomerase n=1 Tax=Slackia heliotrinireducens (strain ATCC 29202 / DSM 20476 / NCTC 11029 / RHS 1) TaxID=471855 RepID=C7N1X7_SLAHD|nr:isopentenyl-diphosphate Delta-isomerase [Slackia heliotrinireducens]ACV23418.1 isopentenyl-diphosphate delta-isomerase, type 1 [Slackia heliotrinireducens DSM 20476]VEH02719.1 Isopentenyl-diphosphate Delta-isomerase [Slackia heliotrinireducens]
MNVEHVVECNRQPDPMASDPAKSDELILVDVFDNPVGTASKERVHRESLLHRAFSVVLVRDGASGPEVLVTRRAPCKYHSAGLWTNSCCSHPRVGESTVDAAYRRVAQELGVQARDLREIGSFIYRASFPSGIAEYEYDHVFVGGCEGELRPDPSETDGVRWMPLADLADELIMQPAAFAPWSLTVFPMVLVFLADR